jgi:hypothetical protein
MPVGVLTEYLSAALRFLALRRVQGFRVLAVMDGAAACPLIRGGLMA